MLIRFVIENFLSFKKTTILDMEAGSIREMPENVYHNPGKVDHYRILKSAALYGANASGKSNILKAFMFMRNFVLGSADNKTNYDLLAKPFRLDVESENKPSLFEVTIVINDYTYRFGFAILEHLIFSEWLYVTEKKKEIRLFYRDANGFDIDKKFKNESDGQLLMISSITKKNSLFISTLGQFKNNTATKLIQWFEKSFVILSSDSPELLNYTASLLSEPYFRRRMIDIIAKADLGFSSIDAEIKDRAKRSGFDEWIISALYSNEFNYRIKTSHKKFDNNNHIGYTFFDLVENESLGSQKFVILLGPILKAITENAIIWIDELDARLHTNLLLFTLRFFNSHINNTGGAQLIYTAHNSLILKKDLRRDQMYFVKRDGPNGSLITSLYKWDSKIRSDSSFDKDYLEGKYGAVPQIDISPDLFD